MTYLDDTIKVAEALRYRGKFAEAAQKYEDLNDWAASHAVQGRHDFRSKDVMEGWEDAFFLLAHHCRERAAEQAEADQIIAQVFDINEDHLEMAEV